MTFAKRHADLLALSLLTVVVLIYAIWFVDFNIPPFEDAAMLMRYADHLAHGYGVVWNIGEPPVDGATDFLFMAASAALIKIGLPVGRSIRVIGFASHLLTVLVVYWVNRKIWRAQLLPSFLSGLYLAVGTGLSYVAAFFGTPFFALFATLTWTLGLLLTQKEDAPFWLCLLFALSGLITGLIRPEGVILAALMLIAVIVLKGWRASSKIIIVFMSIFLVLGGVYFAWRWNYFGYPLPNPFYKKGGGVLHWDSFWESFGYLFRFGGLFMLAFLLGFRSGRTTKQTVAFLIPLVFFAAAFILIDNQTNAGGRFQYALWPLVMISWYPLVSGSGQEINFSWPVMGAKASSSNLDARARAVWSLLPFVLVCSLAYYSVQQSCVMGTLQLSCVTPPASDDGRYAAAEALSNYQGRGYVIATSEAGLLPFYSGWTAVDTWGLNDEWIAHHGEITPEYLDRYKPDVIMFHAYFSPLLPPKLIDKNLAQDWFRMTITLKDYAESHGYVLAAAFGDDPREAHYYYVRSDFPDSARIVKAISSLRYAWYTNGKKAINYAGLNP